MVWTRAADVVVAIVLVVGGVASLVAQTPKPFPSPGQPPPAPGRPGSAAPAESTPTEATLGAPIFPNAQFLTSYDAGRGQRFYLYGASAAYLDVVTFYRTSLKQRGEVLFEQPPTHQFETGRFRDETMAFPPSVTVKDYTFGGSAGYPNPKAGAQPARFQTVIQIVPAPAGTPPGM